MTGPRQQLSAGGTSSLAAATKKQPGSALSLTPSLSNYYKEHLVDHVQGWPSDTVEKQVSLDKKDGCYTFLDHTDENTPLEIGVVNMHGNECMTFLE